MASQAEIQQAYLQLARDVHPDRNRTACAEEAFKRVAHAKSVLSGVATRAAHDAEMNGGGPAATKRRPCERRASRKRKERSSTKQAGREDPLHDERCGVDDNGGGEGLESDEEIDSQMWCSFQGRDTNFGGTRADGSRARKMSKAKRRATASKASAVAGAGRVVTEERSAGVRAGKGRGSLGKRPWRRTARIAAKLDAKQAKSRSKARRHLQTG